jgi:hypothetical protein
VRRIVFGLLLAGVLALMPARADAQEDDLELVRLEYTGACSSAQPDCETWQFHVLTGACGDGNGATVYADQEPLPSELDDTVIEHVNFVARDRPLVVPLLFEPDTPTETLYGIVTCRQGSDPPTRRSAMVSSPRQITTDSLVIDTLQPVAPCAGRAGCDLWNATGRAVCDAGQNAAVWAGAEPLPRAPGAELRRIQFTSSEQGFSVDFSFDFEQPYDELWAAVGCESGGTVVSLSDQVQYDRAAGQQVTDPRGGGGTDPTVAPPASTGDTPHERAAIAASVRRPGAEGVGAAEYGVALLVATGVALLIVFPSALFNSTLEEHYDEVVGWFRRGRFARAGTAAPAASAAPRAEAAALPAEGGERASPLVFGLVLGVSTLLYGLLDPNLGFDTASAAQLIGIGASMLALTFITGALSGLYIRWRTGRADAHLVAFPWAIAVAAGCVVVSRVLDFQPGYVYGVIGGLAFSAELSTRDDGRASAAAAMALLVVSLSAWFLWSPVADAAADADPGFLTVVADGLLGAIVVAGVEGLVLGLIPLRFLPGESLVRWSKAVWLALFLGGLFLYAHLFVRPAVGDDTPPGPSVVTAVGLFVAFAVVSVGFWGYFRFRPARQEVPTA